jgi:hypothetical protein
MFVYDVKCATVHCWVCSTGVLLLIVIIASFDTVTFRQNCNLMYFMTAGLMAVQAGPVLCDFFLHDFALMRMENLHHFSNLRDNFHFNAIWHRRSVAALVFCRRLAESVVTVTPSVTCRDWLYWWYNHAAYLVSSSTALAFLTNMSERCKSASPSAVQV